MIDRNLRLSMKKKSSLHEERGYTGKARPLKQSRSCSWRGGAACSINRASGRKISLDIREEEGKSRHPDKSPRRLPLENHHSGIVKEIIWKPKGSKYISQKQKQKRNVLVPPITSSLHTLCACLPGGDQICRAPFPGQPIFRVIQTLLYWLDELA